MALEKNMPCLTSADLQSKWNGLLTEEEQERQAEHLAGCSKCQQLEMSLRSVWSLLPLISQGKVWETTPACLSESVFIRYFYGGMSEGETAKVHSHLVECRHCLEQAAAVILAKDQPIPLVGEEWQPALAWAENLIPATEAGRGWKVRFPVVRWQWAMASMVLATVLVVGVVWHHAQSGKNLTPHRGATPAVTANVPPSHGESKKEAPLLAAVPKTQQPAVSSIPPQHLRAPDLPPMGSMELVSPREGQHIAERNLEFRWRPVGRANAYEVALLSRKGDVIWEAKVKGLSTHLPAGVHLQSGEQYFAWVIAYRDGESPLRSPSVAFKVLPPDMTH